MSTDHFLDPALLMEVVDEQAGDFRRDLSWAVQCRCSHLHSEHRPDLKTTSPCGRGGCGCQHMRPQYVVWFEHRRVYGLIKEQA